MYKYDKQEVSNKFTAAMWLLERGDYRESSPLFSELIAITSTQRHDADAQIKYEAALNNRGMAKCMWAKELRDRVLFLEGIEDYKRSIGDSKDFDEPLLIARGNLRIAEEELKQYDREGKWRDSGLARP